MPLILLLHVASLVLRAFVDFDFVTQICE